MAAGTTTRTRRGAEADEEEVKRPASRDADDDDDDEENVPTSRYADDDDDDFDDDDDDIVVGDGWEEAEAPTGDFPWVAGGTYVICLRDTDVRTASEKAKNPGSKYGVLVFTIDADYNPSKMEENDPTVRMWHNLFMTPKSYGRTKKFVSDMGVKLAVGDKVMAPLRDLAEQEACFEAVIGIEKYRAEDPNTGKTINKKRNKILRILGPTDL